MYVFYTLLINDGVHAPIMSVHGTIISVHATIISVHKTMIISCESSKNGKHTYIRAYAHLCATVCMFISTQANAYVSSLTKFVLFMLLKAHVQKSKLHTLRASVHMYVLSCCSTAWNNKISDQHLCMMYRYGHDVPVWTWCTGMDMMYRYGHDVPVWTWCTGMDTHAHTTTKVQRHFRRARMHAQTTHACIDHTCMHRPIHYARIWAR